MSGLEGLLTGRTLVNRYRIEAVIGRGGFAAVYRASDQRLDRTVAVKVITLAASDEETRKHLRERFQREARSAASLPQHPNVITVHDFGTDPDLGLDFLVMEFLHGEDLATHLARQRKLSLDAALGVLRDAIEGVAVGHRENLIHRDVKPGNIFLAEPHGSDPFRVCVLDFGIAHVMTKDQTVTRLTQGGVPLSPAYASPEQLRGDRNLTCASDVFSLGVVAYQLLTGEKPLRADRSTDAVDWKPEKGIRELSPEVPVEVEAVVRKAMAFAPEARYQDAGEMARALDAAMSGVPVTAPVAPVAAAGAAAPVFAGAAIGDDDERTLLHPEPAPAPISSRPAAHTPVAEPAGGGSPFGKLWVIGLIAAVLTLGGLWALTRGGAPDQPASSGEIILDGSGDSRDPAPRSETPRVTGEIIEDPRFDPDGGTTIQPDDAPVDPTPFPPSDSRGGTVVMPPQPRPQEPAPQQPLPQQPAPQEPAPQQPSGAQPAPQQPTPAQPVQPAPQPQPEQPAPQPEGPPLLGEPAQPVQPTPAPPSGGAGPMPPDTSGAAG